MTVIGDRLIAIVVRDACAHLEDIGVGDLGSLRGQLPKPSTSRHEGVCWCNHLHVSKRILAARSKLRSDSSNYPIEICQVSKREPPTLARCARVATIVLLYLVFCSETSLTSGRISCFMPPPAR